MTVLPYSFPTGTAYRTISLHVLGDLEDSPIIHVTNSMIGLQFLPGSGRGEFRPYQPQGGGNLIVETYDSFSLAPTRARIGPERPGGKVSGPGTIGAGEVTFNIFNAPPGGMAFIYFGPSEQYMQEERKLMITRTGLPLFLGLNRSTLMRLPLPIGINGSGTGTLKFQNPGGLEGTLAIQALTFGSGGKLKQFSRVAFL